MKKKFLAFSTALVLALSSFTSIASAAPADVLAKISSDSDSIVILHLNDTHSRVDATDTNVGFAKFSELVKEAKEINPNTLVLDAGDTFHGQIFANLEKGESIVKVLNEIDYDAMTAGNHDFNYGYTHLLKLSNELNFPLISANVRNSNDELLFTPYILKEVNGKKIGIFGLTTPETSFKTHPDNVKGISFTSPLDEAAASVAALKEEGADIIIALGHIGLDQSTEILSSDIARQVEGIDVFIDGHSHTVLEEGLTVGNTLIASTGEYDNNVGIITLKIDDTGIVSKKAELIPAADMSDFPADAAVEAKINEINEAQKELMAEVIGETAVNLEGAREFVRAGETNLGNLITDAILEISDADAVITNGGGIRASIPEGNITKGDVITVLPFGNFVVTVKITGQAFKDALENGVKAYPEPLGGFPHIAGASFVLDASKPAGERVSELIIGGAPVNLNKEYIIATNDFMAAGGDEFTSLASGTVVNQLPSLEEVVIDYISKIGTVSQEIDGRITIKEAANDADSLAEPIDTPDYKLTVETENNNPPIVLNLDAEPGIPSYLPMVNIYSNDLAAMKISMILKENFEAPPTTANIYLVQPGDTLSSIAEAHGTTWQEIQKINDINSSLIHPNQEILIPAA